MRSLILILALAIGTAAFADIAPVPLQLPSSISGVYKGPDRVCSLVLSESTALTKDAELQCIVWGSQSDQVFNLQRLGQPDGKCPSDSQVFQFRSTFGALLTPNTPGFRIVGINDDSIVVRVGFPGELGLGGGALQTWQRIETLQSPAPYTCGDTAPSPVTSPHYPRLCRLYGQFCGG